MYEDMHQLIAELALKMLNDYFEMKLKKKIGYGLFVRSFRLLNYTMLSEILARDLINDA